MNALYDFFLTPQPKDSNKTRYHARLVVRDTITLEDIAETIESRSSLRQSDVIGSFIDLPMFSNKNYPTGIVFTFRESVHSVSKRNHPKSVLPKKSVPKTSIAVESFLLRKKIYFAN